MNMRPNLSATLAFINAKLAGLSFAGMDQNPHGIRDLVASCAREAEAAEKAAPGDTSCRFIIDVTKKAFSEYPTMHVIRDASGDVIALCPLKDFEVCEGQFSYAPLVQAALNAGVKHIDKGVSLPAHLASEDIVHRLTVAGMRPVAAPAGSDERNDTVDALVRAEEFIRGFEGDELQEGIDDILAGLRAAIARERTSVA